MLGHIVTVVGYASVECTLHSRFVVEANLKTFSWREISSATFPTGHPCIVTQAPLDDFPQIPSQNALLPWVSGMTTRRYGW